MDARDKRLAQNEALFREVNERIDEQAATHLGDGHLYDYFCECANSDCTLRVSLTVREYEEIRRDPRRFLVAPGHEMPEIEAVVARNERYWVIEKHGEAGAYVEHLDPRDRT